MPFLRVPKPDRETAARRQLNRFRNILVLALFLFWGISLPLALLTPNAPDWLLILHGRASGIPLPVTSVVAFFFIYLCTIAAAGLLFRVRCPVWLCCLSAVALGPAFAIGFLFLIAPQLQFLRFLGVSA